MPWAAAAAVVGAGISASSAHNAQNSQEAGAKKSLAEQRRQFDLSRGDFAPYRYAGSQALQKLQALLGIQGPAPTAPDRNSYLIRDHSLDKDRGHAGPLAHLDPGAAFGASKGALPDKAGLFWQPGTKKGYRFDQSAYDAAVQKYNEDLTKYNAYDPKKAAQDVLSGDEVYQSGLKFGQDQGERAINARALAGGGYDSGSTLKALTRFGNDYGSTKAGEVFNRLSGLAGTGQAATGSTSALGANYAGNVGNIYTGLGNAQGASQIAKGNAYGGALNNLGSQYWLSKLTGGGQRTTSGPSSGTYANNDWLTS